MPSNVLILINAWGYRGNGVSAETSHLQMFCQIKETKQNNIGVSAYKCIVKFKKRWRGSPGEDQRGHPRIGNKCIEQ